MTFETLKQAMKTNLEPVVVKSTDCEHNGTKRTLLKVRKARGKMTYTVVRYENGRYSEAV